ARMIPPRMPAVFSAHGNPMNAIRENAFTRFLGTWRRDLPKPCAILVVSAHWEAPALACTGSERPPTIHDFYGFPDELYALRYPAPGDPRLAARVAALTGASIDRERGLDHGAWAPLLKIFPGADVPVVQISLMARAPMERHLDVGRALAPLRDEGVLMLGSG